MRQNHAGGNKSRSTHAEGMRDQEQEYLTLYVELRRAHQCHEEQAKAPHVGEVRRQLTLEKWEENLTMKRWEENLTLEKWEKNLTYERWEELPT